MKFLTATCITLLFASCSNPKSDAKKVCDCYSSIDWTSEKHEYQKFIGLEADMAKKYKDKPSEYLEYRTEADTCMKRALAKMGKDKQ